MMEIDVKRRKELLYRYLSILDDEGVLNEVVFGESECNGGQKGRYATECNSVEKLVEIIPDDVLIRQFGEYECFCDETEMEDV